MLLAKQSYAVLPENRKYSMVKSQIKYVKIKKVGLPVYLLRVVLPYLAKEVKNSGEIWLNSKELRTLMMVSPILTIEFTLPNLK